MTAAQIYNLIEYYKGLYEAAERPNPIEAANKAVFEQVCKDAGIDPIELEETLGSTCPYAAAEFVAETERMIDTGVLGENVNEMTLDELLSEFEQFVEDRPYLQD